MLSPIVEYLFALRRTTGGPLCYPGRLQYIIPVIPPGITLSFALTPPSNCYACIKYSSTLSNQMVPGALYLDILQAGNKYALGFDEADWNREYLAYFVVFTHSDPIYMQVTNVSALNQWSAATQWNVMISTEKDYNQVLEHIVAWSTIASSRLAEDANKLLTAIRNNTERLVSS